MNDSIKGLSILSVTAVAIAWVLNSDNSGWEIPFLAFKGEETRDVLALQREILAGADPTLTQQATAAGQRDGACYTGWVSMQGSESQVKQSYHGVLAKQRLYIRLLDQGIMLDMPLTEPSKATKPSVVPVSVALGLADMNSKQESCEEKNLTVSLLK